MYSARQLSDDDNSSSGTLSLSTKPHFRSRSLLHRSYSANAALASSPFNLAARPRTWLLSSIFAMASEGSLHMSIPAVVFVARQSKFGSTNIAILSSVSFNRQVLIDLASWFEIFCFPKIPQLELRLLIHSAFSSIARRRFGSRSSLSCIALFSFAEAALSSGSPQNNWSAGSLNAPQ